MISSGTGEHNTSACHGENSSSTPPIATRKSLGKVRAAVTKRADNLKGLDPREQDAFWPLIYQIWSEADLRGNGQDLLADLKKANFAFVRF